MLLRLLFNVFNECNFDINDFRYEKLNFVNNECFSNVKTDKNDNKSLTHSNKDLDIDDNHQGWFGIKYEKKGNNLLNINEQNLIHSDKHRFTKIAIFINRMLIFIVFLFAFVFLILYRKYEDLKVLSLFMIYFDNINFDYLDVLQKIHFLFGILLYLIIFIYYLKIQKEKYNNMVYLSFILTSIFHLIYNKIMFVYVYLWSLLCFFCYLSYEKYYFKIITFDFLLYTILISLKYLSSTKIPYIYFCFSKLSVVIIFVLYLCEKELNKILLSEYIYRPIDLIKKLNDFSLYVLHENNFKLEYSSKNIFKKEYSYDYLMNNLDINNLKVNILSFNNEILGFILCNKENYKNFNYIKKNAFIYLIKKFMLYFSNFTTLSYEYLSTAKNILRNLKVDNNILKLEIGYCFNKISSTCQTQKDNCLHYFEIDEIEKLFSLIKLSSLKTVFSYSIDSKYKGILGKNFLIKEIIFNLINQCIKTSPKTLKAKLYCENEQIIINIQSSDKIEIDFNNYLKFLIKKTNCLINNFKNTINIIFNLQL